MSKIDWTLIIGYPLAEAVEYIKEENQKYRIVMTAPPKKRANDSVRRWRKNNREKDDAIQRRSYHKHAEERRKKQREYRKRRKVANEICNSYGIKNTRYKNGVGSKSREKRNHHNKTGKAGRASHERK